MKWLRLVCFFMVAACSSKGDGARGGRDAPAETPRVDAAASPLVVAAPATPYVGPDCSSAYAPRPDRDPSPMCFAPGGAFMMGVPEDRLDPAAPHWWPKHRVTLAPYFIDQHEVTMEQFFAFMASDEGKALGCEVLLPEFCPRQNTTLKPPFEIDTPPKGKATSETARITIPPGHERHPMSEVSLEGASAYCAWAGKRLPTDAEWEYAAVHDPVTGKDRAFPWGDRFEQRRSNCDRQGCGDDFEGAAPVGSFDGTGAHKDGRSAIGVHDMHGNVREWVGECYPGRYVPCEGDCVAPVPGPIARCGRFLSRDPESHDWHNDPPSPSWFRVGVPRGITTRKGFRCAASSGPSRPADEARTPPRSSPP